MIFILSK